MGLFGADDKRLMGLLYVTIAHELATPMRRRLPPLNALPSFEAAARHLSFSRAADELHVTHGAVSRAVRHLEDHLGVQLMLRATRSVRLTPIGASFVAEIRDVLEHLAAATVAAR